MPEWTVSPAFVLENEERSQENLCNTEKDRDSRVNRHTCGMLLGVYSCGFVAFFEEIFGCESKSQVYAIFLEWLATIDEDKRPVTLLYDDSCHLVHVVRKLEKVHPNKHTKYFGSMKLCVDFLHFRNHRGEKCKKECNPYDHEELKAVNSVACEQFFARSHKYRQVCSMNRESFLTFWTYVLDLNNLRKEDKLRFAANPRSNFRMKFIVDDMCAQMNKMKIGVGTSGEDGGARRAAAAVGIAARAGEDDGDRRAAAVGIASAVSRVPKNIKPLTFCSCDKRNKCLTLKCNCYQSKVKCNQNCHNQAKSARCENKEIE